MADATTETKPLSLRERQRAEREVLILAEAERLLSAEGYEGLVLDRLADLVGVSKGTLYQHFANKEDLVGAVILQGMARLDALLATQIAAGDRPVAERLGAVLASMIEGDFAWMSTVTGPQKHALADALRDHPGLREAYLRFFDGLCTLIRHGQTGGEFDPAFPAPTAARFLLALVQAQGARTLPGEAPLDKQAAAALAVRFYVRGLRTQPTR